MYLFLSRYYNPESFPSPLDLKSEVEFLGRVLTMNEEICNGIKRPCGLLTADFLVVVKESVLMSQIYTTIP